MLFGVQMNPFSENYIYLFNLFDKLHLFDVVLFTIYFTGAVRYEK